MDLSFADALLLHGFGLGEAQEVTLVKQIEFKGVPTEAAWPLGCAINTLGAAAGEQAGGVVRDDDAAAGAPVGVAV